MNEHKTGESVSVAVLATLAVVATLYFGSEFFVPIAFAAVLSVALRPIVRFLKRLGIPASLGSGIIVLSLVGLLTVGGWLLSGQVKYWAAQMPQMLSAAQGRIEAIRKPLQNFSDMAGKLRDGTAASQPSTQPTTQPLAERPPTAAPETKGPEAPGALASAIGLTRRLLSAIIEIVLLVYLMLATDNLFFRKLIKVMPGLRDKHAAAEATDEVQDVIHRYLYVITSINCAMGVVVTLVLWWLGLPAPWIWGLAAVVLEFIPYLGATVMVALLTITALASGHGGWHIAALPGSYILITTINNSVVSPYVYGNRLKLNPVAVLVGVLFWWFLWGVPGAFLAVPIVATAKIIADRVEGWKGVGEFLGE